MDLLTELLESLKHTDQLEAVTDLHRKKHSGEHFKEVLDDTQHLAEILERDYQGEQERAEVGHKTFLSPTHLTVLFAVDPDPGARPQPDYRGRAQGPGEHGRHQQLGRRKDG